MALKKKTATKIVLILALAALLLSGMVPFLLVLING